MYKYIDEQLKWVRENGNFAQFDNTRKDCIEITTNSNYHIAFKQYADKFHEAAKYLMEYIIVETSLKDGLKF